MSVIAGLNRKHNAVITVRDADVVAAALRRALAEAPPEDRAALERAVALVESTAEATDAQIRARWARDLLTAAGYTGDLASVAAVKALRQADPRLSLLAAVQLQKEAIAHPE
ncbi:hypothetical protein [Streptomyces mangrovisoli]|uniref:Uncharacterized protein n=1 Tax=Streptomyces mangrovisoli TaxID=1428628 RepID=A0A1J4NPA2_9ACTN|nr:hypothetical protein [Streptomyces mangrovisoli]OIJ64257.1 hypothetical protein WN71_029250 [Streptomyces mangrovisoli]